MKKVTYFDVEYANSKNKSICQIGIMCEDYETKDPVYPERSIYIDPEDGFDPNCIAVHNITPDKVNGMPPFPVVWSEIKKYFSNAVIVGHNVAASDLDALVKQLKRYNIDIPEFYYICTLELAKTYVPKFAILNYSMSSLCNYFDVDIDSVHDAFYDARANANLLKRLVKSYSIDIDEHIKKYVLHYTDEHIDYISSPIMRRSISEFYGIIRGFSIDGKITDDEQRYIETWRNNFKKYINQPEIADIIKTIDQILKDGIITNAETLNLQQTIKKYLNTSSASAVTLSTQILNGIMKGIIADGKITNEECISLRQWLYDNIYLKGHYPFDMLTGTIEKILEDSTITEQELDLLNEQIKNLLDPVESLSAQINSVENKHVCLSGNFSYGSKSQVEQYISAKNGLIDKNVKTTTDILIIGDRECLSYSNGTYGTKVKKAMEFNEKGCNISIIKESDFFKTK